MRVIKYLCMTVLVCITVSPALGIEWTNGSGDRLWGNSANWAGGVIPTTWAQVAQIDATLPGPIIDSSVNTPYLAGLGINIGDSGNGTGTLTMTGGLMTAGTHGTTAFAGVGWVVIGFGDASNPLCNGVLNMQGGTLDDRWDFMVAAHGGGNGTVNMTGGTILAHRLWVGHYTGFGQINLDDGIIDMSWAPGALGNAGNGNLISIGNGNIDIEKGQMHILGDFSTQIQQYITDEKITGYNGTQQVFVDYDHMIAGYTVVYVPEPMTMILLGMGSVILSHRRKNR